MTAIPQVTIDELIDRYDALLLDAYGVLVNGDGALPGAAELVATLNGTGKPYTWSPIPRRTCRKAPPPATARSGWRCPRNEF